jgi:hypothetical protein
MVDVWQMLSGDRAAAAAGLLAPPAVAAVLVPCRASFAGAGVALVLLVVVAVAASGHRLAGLLAAASAGRRWDVERDGLPAGDTELLVENRGVLQGRFLLTPLPGARPALEQRQLAIALADQVGAALAASQPAGR